MNLNIRTGIDIVEISRMTESIAQRILGKDEKVIYDSLGGERRRMEFAAGRFAAKEAFVKALGRKDIEFSKIQFLTDEGGRPIPSDELKQLIKNSDLTVSISHEREYAVSIVILFGEDQNDNV
ncbi:MULTISPECIES: holo-ACP synthase [Mesotoga]|uniref:holo-ACP synthase n=1 Tax=Mesotoga TaxID=1184396 RepID=UPI0002CB5586|nr:MULTISPECIES: holo-ACP synthase [Mesotoga]MCP5456921.1 holo-ACP synthase [Thermotogota bacterium]CCU85981.1 Holo-(acyl-carrier-protein) synthase [Mesotoga infera]MCB1222345.1 holo-ACP synthase [Mesotoga sp.]MCP5461341.1 holo-ACP synthase [Thermotogota bacterium]HNQ69987.1 holo-ACP synthase [Mesotoga prima]